MHPKFPPGKIKILKALTRLLEVKNFNAITTANIAGEAGVTEGLIYKHFKDKNDLLFELLAENITRFHQQLTTILDEKKDTRAKLETFISTTLKAYRDNRVFGRILLLEVRNCSAYFDSRAYVLMRRIEDTIRGIISDGMAKGEIRKDIDPAILQKVIAGAMEHGCMDAVIFNRDMDIAITSQQINAIIFKGVAP